MPCYQAQDPEATVAPLQRRGRSLADCAVIDDQAGAEGERGERQPSAGKLWKHRDHAEKKVSSRGVRSR